jgi:hypothetical protein
LEAPLETSTQEDFLKRCERVSEYAHGAGLTVTKMPHAFAVTVSKNGDSIAFPIVTDASDWRETTPEEAFYCAVTDAFAWCSARPGEAAFATLDAIERSGIPVIQRDLEEQMGRVRALTQLLGGSEALRRLWEAAGIDPNAAASIDLR